jgi:sec-independent protein translocase protein TatC
MGAAPLRKDDWDDEYGSPLGSMSFLEHLDELRRRLLHAVAALFLGILAASAYWTELFEFVVGPLRALLGGEKLKSFDPPEAFVIQFKIVAIAGTMLALPYILLHVWRFIAPGLHRHEKKLVIPFVTLATLLFVAGALFAHYVLVPSTWLFFQSFESDSLDMEPAIGPVFSLWLRLVWATALAFQLPTVAMVLGRFGLITARWMIRKFKYAVLIAFIAAAVLTAGPDPFVQALVAGPLIGLYVLSIGLVWLVGKRERSGRRARVDTVQRR